MQVPKKLSGATLITALGLGSILAILADPLLAQVSSITTIEDADVAELLEDNNCAILTEEGLIVEVEGADADTDGDGRVERFCTPGRVERIVENEQFAEVEMLTQTDYDDDGEYESGELLAIDINNIRSVREVTPGNYVIAISRTGTVNEANVSDLVEISEEQAFALLEEIERSRVTVIEVQEEVTPAPAPAPLPTPLPAPAPTPAPPVQPTPPPAPPALW
jgi:hypothetical protein